MLFSLPALPLDFGLLLENNMRVLAISALAAGLLASPYGFSADKAKATRHLTADQATNCIKQAAGAKAGGYITKLEVSVDDGKTICEVHFEDSKGKNSEAKVDVAANKVLKVKD
jgi:hypothetical protein